MGTKGFGAGPLRPRDAAYAEEIAGFQTGFAQRPDVVFPAASAQDVAAAVAYAARERLPLGVQATGHGLPGAARGGVLVTTRRMDGVTVNAAARRVRIGAGARWGQVVAAAAPHGLAPLNGSSPGVGAVSYTLGGGLGILGREFGHAADRVHWLDVVTADARPRRVTASSEPDLFWALRGGGGDFAVVTALEMDLVPVAEVYGGALVFDGRVVEPGVLLRGYEEWTRTLPRTLTSSLAALPYPNAPFVPEPLRGRYALSVRIAFTGSTAEGERLVAPLRGLGPLLSDSLRRMPYTATPAIHGDPPVPHAYHGDSVMLRELDVAATTEVLGLAGPGAPMMCVVQVNHLGGALAEPPAVPNAVPHRGARFLLRLLSVLDGTDMAAVRDLHGRAFARLAPWTAGRSLNFSFGGGDRPEGLYGAAARDRLAEVKQRYDPTCLFRGNAAFSRVLAACGPDAPPVSAARAARPRAARPSPERP